MSRMNIYTKLMLMNIDLFLEMNLKMFCIFSNKMQHLSYKKKQNTCLKTKFSLPPQALHVH